MLLKKNKSKMKLLKKKIMGHIINPIAFRLGHSRSWENIWYIKNIYYPEFLHNILNVRNFIYYFFKKKIILKIGLFFSHFNIFKYNKFYIVKIYIYNLDLEKVSYSFINKIYTVYYKNLKKKEKRITKTIFFFYIILMHLYFYLYLVLYYLNINNIDK